MICGRPERHRRQSGAPPRGHNFEARGRAVTPAVARCNGAERAVWRDRSRRRAHRRSTDAAEASENPAAMIRPATADDISALVGIENRAFTTDRISRRAFRYLMSKANAATLVATEAGGGISGYAIVLFNRGTSLARLYGV